MILKGLHEKDIFTKGTSLRYVENISTSIDYPMHWHNAVEILYVLDGTSVINVNAQKYTLSTGDILFIAAGDIHDFSTTPKDKNMIIQFDLNILENFDIMNMLKPFISRTTKIAFSENEQLSGELLNQMLFIKNEYQKKAFGYELYLNARIYDILVLIARNYTDSITEQSQHSDLKRVAGFNKLNKAFQFIEENYKDPISLKEVAYASGFSEYYFSRLFNDVTEKTFSTYLNEIRIRKAEKILSKDDASITDAAHEAGFNSMVTFNRMFKKIVGCTPTAYKKLKA